jgi:hypothetical protein
VVPEGKADDVIVSGFVAAGAVIVSVADCIWIGEPLSLTLTVKLEELPEVGVPEIVPVDAIERPAGNWPEVIDHTYGATPPVAWRVWV